ncbi:MAG: ribosomal protein S18-alanine N-acetyltransferase [Haloarculaceae archaeon]
MTTTAPEADAGVGARIREAERADLLAVFHIEQESFPQPWPFSAFEQFLGEPGFLVAQVSGDDGRETATVGDDGRVVGYVVADTVPNHGEALGHVKDLAVAPEHRGLGLGKRLLGSALNALTAQGVGSVKLEVRRSNDAARGLYRRFGFRQREVVPRYYSNGEDALVLVREF